MREYGHDSETLNVIYVVDDRGKLIHDLRIRETLVWLLTTKVSEIRNHAFAALNVNDRQEAALNIFRKIRSRSLTGSSIPMACSFALSPAMTCLTLQKRKRRRYSKNRRLGSVG